MDVKALNDVNVGRENVPVCMLTQTTRKVVNLFQCEISVKQKKFAGNLGYRYFLIPVALPKMLIS